MDLDGRRFEVYHHDGEGYPTPTLHYPGEMLEPAALPAVLVDISVVLGEE